MKCGQGCGLAQARILCLHLSGQNLAGRCPYGIFEQRLCKEKQKHLDEGSDDGEKRRGNQRELDRCCALFVLDKDDEAAAASFSCCDFHLGHRRVSHCVRLAVLDATLMNRSVSACVILPPV